MKELYYHDQYMKSWTSQLISSEKIDRDGKMFFAVELDRTCCYPEGGGQPGDRGSIGEVKILDTVKKEGKILHLCSEDPGKGEHLCTLDWKHRFDYMQQHTGQHILSAVLKQQFDINTVSVHQGNEYTAVETDSPEMNEEQLYKLNEESNRMILENRAVIIKNIDSEDLGNYTLRRPTSRSGIIRLVEIEGADLAACGGVHCSSTSEVRLIHVYMAEKIRGRCRVLAKIGDRALEDYQQKTESSLFISKSLSVPSDQIISAFIRYTEEMSALKNTVSSLESSLSDAYIKELSCSRSGSVKLYSGSFNDVSKNITKEMAKKLIAGRETVFFLTNTAGGRILWSLGSSEDTDLPFTEIKSELFKLLEAKGGGKSPLWQGMAESINNLDVFLGFLSDKLEDL